MTNTTSATSTQKPSLKERMAEEAKKAFALTMYFGVWFCALTFLAVTALEERPIPLSIFGLAIVKAGITAKFMLIGQAIYPIKVTTKFGILRSILVESFIYSLIILALNYLEAGIEGLIHGKNFLISMAAFGHADPLHILAMMIVYWLIVLPYLIFAVSLIMMGKKNFMTLLLGNKTPQSH
jgi:hypothetical protein